MKKIALLIFLVSITTLFLWVAIFGGGKRESETWTIEGEKEIANKDDGKNAEKREVEQEKIFHKDSIPAMREKEFQGDGLQTGKVLDTNNDYVRYYITYNSEGLEISGIMNVPKGEGIFPILILNHGYIDPAVYTNGRGLKREQDFLAKRGYVVVHSDYRNLSDSDFDPGNDVRPRSGYVEDIMNLISAVQKSELAFLDKENIGMLGHSMGGGISINVMTINPESVKAYVLLAPINAQYSENFYRWVDKEWPDLAQEVFDAYGSFEENPDYWEGVSAANFLGDVGDPVQLHQGTADVDGPVQWSQDLNKTLMKERKEVTYYEYPGDGHSFLNNFPIVMKRTVEFFDEKLK